MPSVYNFSETEIIAFALTLLRVSAFFVTWPVLGSESVPRTVKILFSLITTLVIFPSLSWDGLVVHIDTLNLGWLALKEVFVGALLGFLARFFFFTISIAGQLISLAMGLSNSQVFDPSQGTTQSVIERTHSVIATLFFLAINGHHLLVSGLVESFSIITLTQLTVQVDAFSTLIPMLQEIMVIGLKMSGPVMIAILFMNLAMAVIGRAVPQINVLVTSLPVNILVGFIIMGVTLPVLIWHMGDLTNITTERLFELMKKL